MTARRRRRRALQVVGRAIDDQLEDPQQRLLGAPRAARRFLRWLRSRPAARSGSSAGRAPRARTRRASARARRRRRRHQRRREIVGAAFERQPAARLDLADLTLGRTRRPVAALTRRSPRRSARADRSRRPRRRRAPAGMGRDHGPGATPGRPRPGRARLVAPQRLSRRSWSTAASSTGFRGASEPDSG